MKGAGRYPRQALSLRRVSLSQRVQTPAPLNHRPPVNRAERRALARAQARAKRQGER